MADFTKMGKEEVREYLQMSAAASGVKASGKHKGDDAWKNIAINEEYIEELMAGNDLYVDKNGNMMYLPVGTDPATLDKK